MKHSQPSHSARLLASHKKDIWGNFFPQQLFLIIQWDSRCILQLNDGGLDLWRTTPALTAISPDTQTTEGSVEHHRWCRHSPLPPPSTRRTMPVVTPQKQLRNRSRIVTKSSKTGLKVRHLQIRQELNWTCTLMFCNGWSETTVGGVWSITARTWRLCTVSVTSTILGFTFKGPKIDFTNFFN